MTYKIKCIAIDDEPLALGVLASYIQPFPSFELVETFEDAINAAEYLSQASVDLLFVDIQMPDISGLELVASLPNKPIIIFTTAYRDFAYEGFELEALDYLVKPISKQRFERAMSKALEYYQYKNGAIMPSSSEVFYVYSRYQKVKIIQAEVEYIESLKDYCKIYLSEGEPVSTLMPLKKLSDKLNPQKFIRIHRSYLIPLQKVRSFIKQKVTLTSGIALPVSNKYSAALQKALSV